jgi:thiolase-like protein
MPVAYSLGKRVEAGDLTSHYKGLHSVCALVGVNGLHVRVVARNVVLEQDPVPAQDVPRVGTYLAPLFGVVHLRQRSHSPGHLALLEELQEPQAHELQPEVMGIGPAVAIPKVLDLTGLSFDDIDLIEFNEAFAAQALAVIREVGMDLEKTNVNGGAIALGHPMGATGTKLTIQLIHEMKRRDSRCGMVTMCIGGGMGAAGIFENLQN